MKSQRKFLILTILFIFLIIEGLSYSYFMISEDDKKIQIYKEKRVGALSFKYFSDVGLVLPEPNKTIVHYTDEFIDRFTTKDLKNDGKGFYDDGIDNRKFKSIALGDSFTRGIGSENNIKFGWVELLEEEIENLDVVNLGNWSSIHKQFYAYQNLINYFEHDILIYNWCSGNDIRESAQDYSFDFYIKKKEDVGIDTKDIIKKLSTSHGYKYHMEYLKNNNFRFYSLYFLLKFFDLANIKLQKKDMFVEELKEKSSFGIVDKDLKLELKKEMVNTTQVCEDKYCYREDLYFKNEILYGKLLNNAAEQINNLFKYAKKKNKIFIFIIHPVARNFFEERTVVNYNEMNSDLIKLLDKNIKVINLTPILNEYDKKNINSKIFHKFDGHYTKEGYSIVSKEIARELKKLVLN